MTEPVIVELAVNGATPRHRNRHVPRTPAEITEVALAGIAEPSGLPWSVAVPGGDVAGCGLAELAIRRGGHVRVGLEDYAGPGEPSNLDLLRARDPRRWRPRRAAGRGWTAPPGPRSPPARPGRARRGG